MSDDTIDREVLKDYLDGFYTYDDGVVDSGIFNPERRALCRAQIRANPELIRQFAAELYQEPDYGDEDRAAFIEWAELDL